MSAPLYQPREQGKLYEAGSKEFEKEKADLIHDREIKAKALSESFPLLPKLQDPIMIYWSNDEGKTWRPNIANKNITLQKFGNYLSPAGANSLFDERTGQQLVVTDIKDGARIIARIK
jgi:hypothetical protein